MDDALWEEYNSLLDVTDGDSWAFSPIFISVCLSSTDSEVVELDLAAIIPEPPEEGATRRNIKRTTANLRNGAYFLPLDLHSDPCQKVAKKAIINYFYASPQRSD